MDFGLLVGIDAYPSQPLQGCIDDVTDMGDQLVSGCGFETSFDVLTDRDATHQGICEHLEEMVARAQPGDRVVFLQSSHGATILDEGGVLQQALVPIDWDWTIEKAITGHYLAGALSKIREGVDFVAIFDACHSGSLSVDRALSPNGPAPGSWRSKSLIIPHGMAKPFPHMTIRTMGQAAELAKFALITGCRADQTAADASFEHPNGAMTYFLLRELEKDRTRPLVLIVAAVNAALEAAGYPQEPQCEGNPLSLARGFMIQPS